jgi:hypothetical protein
MFQVSRNSVTTSSAFGAAQQAGVDEEADELVADRLVQQRGADRRIDTAGEAADRSTASLACPSAWSGATRVDHLGTEHRAIEAPLVVGDDGEGRTLADRDDPETRRQCLDAVAVAHPHLFLASLGPEIGEEYAFARHFDEGAAEFTMVWVATAPPSCAHIACYLYLIGRLKIGHFALGSITGLP